MIRTLATLIIGVLIGWACSGLLDKLALYIHNNWR